MDQLVWLLLLAAAAAATVSAQSTVTSTFTTTGDYVTTRDIQYVVGWGAGGGGSIHGPGGSGAYVRTTLYYPAGTTLHFVPGGGGQSYNPPLCASGCSAGSPGGGGAGSSSTTAPGGGGGGASYMTQSSLLRLAAAGGGGGGGSCVAGSCIGSMAGGGGCSVGGSGTTAGEIGFPDSQVAGGTGGLYNSTSGITTPGYNPNQSNINTCTNIGTVAVQGVSAVPGSGATGCPRSTGSGNTPGCGGGGGGLGGGGPGSPENFFNRDASSGGGGSSGCFVSASFCQLNACQQGPSGLAPNATDPFYVAGVAVGGVYLGVDGGPGLWGVSECNTGFIGNGVVCVPNPCLSNPCQNGGTCLVDEPTFSFTCACVPGFSGNRCDTNVNECASSPCENGGTCVDLPNGHSCTCASGWSGTTCTITQCVSAPCQNGGTCVDGVDSYTCTCVQGYSGLICQTQINECGSAPCQNGGTCIDRLNGFECNCTALYFDPICSTRLFHPCQSFPCQNGGECADALNTYTCSCLPGFFGSDCQLGTSNDCTSLPCQNGGSCLAPGRVQFPILPGPALPAATGEILGLTYCGDMLFMQSDRNEAHYFRHVTPTTVQTSISPVRPLALAGAQTTLFAVTIPVGFDRLFTTECGATGFSTGIQTPPTVRYEAGLLGYGTRLFSVGGQTVEGVFSSAVATMEVLDTTTWSTSAVGLSTARSSMSGAAVGPYLIQAGGRNLTGHVVSTVDIYNAAIGGPMTTVQLSQPRYGMASVSFFNRHAIFAGGYTDTQNITTARIDIYTYGTDAWTTAELPWPVADLAAATIGDDTVVFGGGRNALGVTTNVTVWNMTTGVFDQSYALTVARAELAAASQGNQVWFAGGINAVGSPVANVDVYRHDEWMSRGFNCTCPPATLGELCQTQTGICTQSGCVCFPGYSGSTCQTAVDACASDPCTNGGTCVYLVNAFRCTCASGFSGGRCETTQCASSPCRNGGSCVNGNSSYTCQCVPGYSGTVCQTETVECESQPCANGGTCVDGVGAYTCLCAGIYVGPQCQSTPCSSDPCVNGGTCVEFVGGYACMCPPGTTGARCQTDLDECSSTPCRNGATCTSSLNGFVCTCFPGYSGAFCDTYTAAWCDKGGGVYMLTPDTTSQLLTTSTSYSGTLQTFPMTFGMWARLSDEGQSVFDQRVLVGLAFNGPGTTFYSWVFTFLNNAVTFRHTSFVQATTSYPYRQWFHMAGSIGVTSNVMTLSLYSDGALVGTDSAAYTDPPASAGFFSMLSFRKSQYDDVRLYNSALSAGQIATGASITAPVWPTPFLLYAFRTNFGTASGTTAVSVNTGSGGALNLTATPGVVAQYAPCGCNGTNLCQNGGVCYDLYGTYPAVCSCLTIPHGSITGPYCATIACNAGWAPPNCIECLPGLYGDDCQFYDVVCNTTEITDRCGYGSLNCTRTCLRATGVCTLSSCDCVDGYTQTNATYCGYRYDSDLCTQPNPPDPTYDYQISTCGVFVTNSSGFVCPTPGPHFSSSGCAPLCTCSSGAGQTPGSAYLCSGFDEACNPADVLEFCPSSASACTKRCEFDPETPTFKSDCVFMADTCVPRIGNSTQTCTPNESLLYCGSSDLVNACVTQVSNGAVIGHTCECAPSVAGLMIDGSCTAWVHYDHSDNSTASGSNCTLECGPQLITTPYGAFGSSYTRGGSNQCAKRRYLSDYAPYAALTSFTPLQVDVLFQRLMARGLVAWNGTGWSDNTDLSGIVFLFSFTVRNCDCMGPYPITRTTTMPGSTLSNGMIYGPLATVSGTDQTMTVQVYSTYASVETIIPGEFRRLYACHGVYVKSVGPFFTALYCPANHVVCGSNCCPVTCPTGFSFCGTVRGCVNTAGTGGTWDDCGGCGRFCSGSCNAGICTRGSDGSGIPLQNVCGSTSVAQCDVQSIPFCTGQTCTGSTSSAQPRCAQTAPTYQCRIGQGTPYTPTCRYDQGYDRCDALNQGAVIDGDCPAGSSCRCTWRGSFLPQIESNTGPCGASDAPTCGAVPGSTTQGACSSGATPTCPGGIGLMCEAGFNSFASFQYPVCTTGGPRPTCASGTSSRCYHSGGGTYTPYCCATCTPGTIPSCNSGTSVRCLGGMPVCENNPQVNPVCADNTVPVCFQELAVCCNKPALTCTQAPCADPTQTQCGTYDSPDCTFLFSNNNHCGACGNVCNATIGQTCFNSVCTSTCTILGSTPCGAYCCGPSDQCVNNICVNGASVNPLVTPNTNFFGLYFIAQPTSTSLKNSLTGLMCSGRGTVVLDTYPIADGVTFPPLLDADDDPVSGQPLRMTAVATCQCDPGWTGTACEIQNCCRLRTASSVPNPQPPSCSSTAVSLPGLCGVALNEGTYWPAPSGTGTGKPCTASANGGSGCCEYGTVVACNSNSLITAGSLYCLHGFLLYTEVGTVCVCDPGFQNTYVNNVPNPTYPCDTALCATDDPEVPCNGRGTPQKYYDPTLGAIVERCECDVGWVGYCCTANIQCGSACAVGSMHSTACLSQVSVYINGALQATGICSINSYTNKTTCASNLVTPLATAGADVFVDSTALQCASTVYGSYSGSCCSQWTWGTTCGGITAVVPSITQYWNGTDLVERSGSTYNDQPQCACTLEPLATSGSFCQTSSCPLGCNGRGTCQNGVCRQVIVSGGQALCGVNGVYTNQFTGCNCDIDQYAGCGTTICSSGQGTCEVSYSNSSQLITSCACLSSRTGTNCEFGACGVANCNNPNGVCNVPSSGPAACVCATSGLASGQIYQGEHCDINVTPQCGVSTIAFGMTACNLRGSCVAPPGSVLPSDYSCNCTQGFTGSKCTSQPCSPTCVHGICTPGSSSSSCVCYQKYSFGDGSCNVDTCANGGVLAHADREAVIGALPAVQCVCDDPTKSFATTPPSGTPACTTLACPADSAGVQCGTADSRAGGINNQNQCNGGTGACVCAWSGALNATSGVCVPRCSPDSAKTTSYNSINVNPGTGLITQFVSCNCRTGWYAPSGCYERTCLNGGFLSGSTCICTSGFTGARCDQAQCSGVGVLNGTSCACPAPYYGSVCQFSLCLRGTANTTSGGCSNCPFAYNGTYCEASRCGPYGTPSPTGNNCTCVDSSITGPFCTVSSCTRGGVINPAQPFRCTCPPQYAGFYCESDACGPAGIYNLVGGYCNCTNTVVRKDPLTGNCTASICGPFGVLNATYTGCTCLSNATLLPRTSVGVSILCFPNCPSNAPYNDAIQNCQADVLSSTASSFPSSTADARSSTATPHSSTADARSSSSTGSPSSTGSTNSSTGGAAAPINDTASDPFKPNSTVVISTTVALALAVLGIGAAVFIGISFVSNTAAIASTTTVAAGVTTAGVRGQPVRRRQLERRHGYDHVPDFSDDDNDRL